MLSMKEYESVLTELGNPDITVSRALVLTNKLRDNYDKVEIDKNLLLNKLEKLNVDLSHVAEMNVHLSEKLYGESLGKGEEEKSFSETVTITELIKGLGMQ